MSIKQRDMSIKQRIGFLSLIAATITIISFLLSLEYKPPGGTTDPDMNDVIIQVNVDSVEGSDVKSCKPQPQEGNHELRDR